MNLKSKLFSTLVIFLLMALFTGQECYAQYFEKPLGIPRKYEQPTIETQEDLGVSTSYMPEPWKVWIDRQGVITSNQKNPTFLEEFWVVEERDEEVHIVKGNGSYNYIEKEFSVSPLPIDYGWVPKKYLILWETALYDKETKFREKVLTITDIEHMVETREIIERGDKLMEYHDSPNTNVPLDLETPLWEVFYVYKTVGKRSLIGKVESLERRKAHDVIHGWVDNSIIQLWGHRQTLEPDKDQRAAMERRAKGVKTSIFANKDYTRAYIEDPTNNVRSFWSDDHFEKGYDTYWYRLPVLSKEDGIIETAVISDLITVKQQGDSIVIDTVDNEEYETLLRLFNEQKERTRQINMVFVIDGTRSMDEPIESVKKAVIKTASRLQESLNKFQFGAVIYRDYKDRNDDACFEVHPLGDYSKFYSFMNSVRTDNPACFNTTVSEGMYKGLLKAETHFREREKETNVIVLVGDAGDREASWRVNENDVVRMLVKNSVSLITIQAHHWDDDAYEQFIYQARDLALISAKQLSEIHKKEYGEANLGVLTTTPKFRVSQQGNRTLYNLEDSPRDGGLQYARQDEEIPAATIEDEVQRIIREIDSANLELLNSMDLMLQSYNDSGTFSPEAIQMLITAKIPRELIELISNKRYQFLISGSTALEVNTLDNPLYDFILFADEEELNGLIKNLNRLVIPRRTSQERRDGLYEAFIKILTINYGISVEDLSGFTLSEIMEKITGLPSASKLLLDYKLSDIREPIAMPNSKLDEIILYIKSKRDLLLRIPEDKRYYFENDFRRYYWLSQQILP